MNNYATELQNITFEHNSISIKRLFDLFFSISVLILGLPLFIILSLCVYFSSPGPIFYHAKRIGLRGKIIYCIKFRSMFVDADEKINHIITKNPLFKEEWEKYKKLKKDPRITPIGRFLRKTSLDELPQFYNVLKGDLSIVGPRPFYLDEILKFFGSKKSTILSIKPGITGLWQTSGRNNLSIKQRVLLEEQYVQNQSLLYDLKLICKTIPVIFFSKGAF